MRHLAFGFMGSALLFAFACGGKVVVESTNSAGAGGTGAGGTGSDSSVIASTGNVSPVGVVSAVSSGSGQGSLCSQFCAKQQAEGCSSMAECLDGCESAYSMAGMCKPQLDAAVQCLISTGDSTCDIPMECAGQLQSYTSCIGPAGCGNNPTSCSVDGGGSCDCQTDCNGSTLEVQCQPGNATDFCVCIKDGMPIDKCPQPQGSGLSCDIVNGCCAKAFFP